MTRAGSNSEQKLFRQLQNAIKNYDEEESVKLTETALGNGLHPLNILESGITPVLSSMGEAFERGEVYLIELMAVSKTVEASMNILQPALESRGQEPEYLGRIVIGTIQGDIHDIGKNVVASLLRAAGFKVTDLGKDVSLEAFVDATRKEDANIVGVSALLTTTMQRQRELIDMLKDSGIRDRVCVIIGGAPSSEAWANEIGADGYAPDATEAVNLAKKLISSRRKMRGGV